MCMARGMCTGTQQAPSSDCVPSTFARLTFQLQLVQRAAALPFWQAVPFRNSS